MVLHGLLWNCLALLALSVSLWSNDPVRISFTITSFITAYGTAWLCMVLQNPVLSCIGLFGNVLPRLVLLVVGTLAWLCVVQYGLVLSYIVLLIS